MMLVFFTLLIKKDFKGTTGSIKYSIISKQILGYKNKLKFNSIQTL
jgi:hypothetical protein